MTVAPLPAPSERKQLRSKTKTSFPVVDEEAEEVEQLPYEDLYLYPGFSFSPLHNFHLLSPSDSDDSAQLHPSAAPPLPLAFYTLRKDRTGAWVSMLAILEADDGDERVMLMEAELYPGSVLYLPSSTYKSTLLTPPNPPTSSPSLLVSDLQPNQDPLADPTTHTASDAAQPDILCLAFRQKAHIQAAAAEQARKDGVLMGWTKKIWGVGLKKSDERIKTWRKIMEVDMEGDGRDACGWTMS